MDEPRVEPGTTDLDPRDGLEVVLSQERPLVSTVAVPVERLRVAKRVVTEERTVTVQVHREELVVERLPLDQTLPDAAVPGAGPEGGAGPREAVVLVLHEEEVRVETVIVPRERVRVLVERSAASTVVETQLAHEVVDVEGPTAGNGAGYEPQGRHRA